MKVNATSVHLVSSSSSETVLENAEPINFILTESVSVIKVSLEEETTVFLKTNPQHAEEMKSFTTVNAEPAHLVPPHPKTHATANKASLMIFNRTDAIKMLSNAHKEEPGMETSANVTTTHTNTTVNAYSVHKAHK